MNNEKECSSCDFKFWEGFESCLEMVIAHAREEGFFESEDIANFFIDEMIDAADLYKKDG